MVTDKEKHKAFASALRELFKRYPLPKYKYRKVQWQRENDREVAIRNALSGSPLYMVNCFISFVPPREIEAVHSLIYG